MIITTDRLHIVKRYETDDGSNYLRYYADVTAYVKQIFGDIISRAELLISEQSSPFSEMSESNLNTLVSKIADRYERTNILDASNELFIMFTNGHRIKFSCSEWASVQRVRKTK